MRLVMEFSGVQEINRRRTSFTCHDVDRNVAWGDGHPAWICGCDRTTTTPTLTTPVNWLAVSNLMESNLTLDRIEQISSLANRPSLLIISIIYLYLCDKLSIVLIWTVTMYVQITDLILPLSNQSI